MKKIAFIFVSIVFAIAAVAQNNIYVNHDAEVLYDLKGPVKKVVIHGGAVPIKHEFDETGKITNSKNTITRDGKGYITKETTSKGRLAPVTEYVYEYDSQHRLKKIKIDSNRSVIYTYDANGHRASREDIVYYGNPIKEKKEVWKYFYNNKSELIKTVKSSTEDKGKQIVETYSNIVTDNYGNALSYNVSKSNGSSYTSQRTITYWDTPQPRPSASATKSSASIWNKYGGKNLKLISYVFPDGRSGSTLNEIFKFNTANGTYNWTGQQNNRSTGGKIAIDGNTLIIYDGDKVFDSWTIVNYDPNAQSIQVKCTYLNLTRFLSVD